MNIRTRPSRLFGLLRASRAPAMPDPADLGTAFGMEVTLDQMPEAAVAPIGEPTAQSGWIHRWTGRKEPRG